MLALPRWGFEGHCEDEGFLLLVFLWLGVDEMKPSDVVVRREYSDQGMGKIGLELLPFYINCGLLLVFVLIG